MAIPIFTECGILPAGVHDCTLAEAEAFLAINEPRSAIWNGLQGFFRWTGPLPAPTSFLIDGSYVTDKATPNDVDVVVDLTGCSNIEFQAWNQIWASHREYAKVNFSVDFYPAVAGIGNDFSAFFQYVRIDEALQRGMSPDVRKGILRLVR
jgi:hypothetical protein